MVEKGDMAALANVHGVFPILVTGDVVKLKSLGIVDTSRLLELDWGASIDLNEKTYSLVNPTLTDRLGMVKRKAQIVTLKDAGVIVARTGIRAGDQVIEAGAGSGALTISLCHAVYPTGHVTTYELREDFADIAGSNIRAAGYGDLSSIKIGNVSKGFTEKDVAAVVMDVPEPWLAIESAHKALRPGGSLVVYVPTINQAEKAVQAAKDAGFVHLSCTETIEREMVVRESGSRPSYDTLGHTGYILTARRL